MDERFYTAVALFLLLNIIAGLVRVVRGPTAADRMLAVQLFGTEGVAILLLLSQGLNQASLRNVALVFAVLAPLTLTAFARNAPELAAGQDKEGE
jgi:multicomponent Na+:H+ antiporter subunit F